MNTAERSGMVLGFGMGGFMDFLLLHLILQWHHMISNRLPPTTLDALRRNLFWDGMGEAAMWAIIFAASLMLLRAARRGERMPGTLRWTGLFVLGWGGFNLLDGIVNHHLMAFHNVRDDVENKMAWNMGFMLVAGVLQPIAGLAMARAGRRRDERNGAAGR